MQYTIRLVPQDGGHFRARLPQAKEDGGHVIPQVRLSPKRKNGIVQWPEKFKQKQDCGLDWLHHRSRLCQTSPKTHLSSEDVPHTTPLSITYLRSIMVLLQQVAYCYLIFPVVAHFRHLLKPLEPCNWTQDINDVFKEAKKVISEKV